MIKFLAKRLIYIFISMLFISMILFSIFQFMPGDPVMRMMEGRMEGLTPEQFEIEVEIMRQMMGMDGPIVYQYYRWIVNLVSGDWGFSIQFRRPVLEVIRVPIGWTVVLNLTSITIGFLITIPLGIFSAVKRGKTFDNSVMVFTTIGFSMPTFLVALLFMIIFAVFWQVLPTSGMIDAIPPDTTMLRFISRLRHMALPIMTVTFVGLAGMTRYVRAAMCDALSEDYIRTARSKGLRDKVVIFSHAFRNALVPIVTLMAGTLMGLFGGSVVIERIFGWSGMGQVMINSIFEGDYAITMGMSVFFAMVSLVSILVMDLAYGLVDPRIKIAG